MARFGARSADAMLALAVGPAGVHSGGPETFAALREVALRHGLTRRTQANEQVAAGRATWSSTAGPSCARHLPGAGVSGAPGRNASGAVPAGGRG